MSDAAEEKTTTKETKEEPKKPGFSWVEVDSGEFLPSIFETNRPLKEHVQCLKALDMRPDDILVLAFPKAGTHWVWEITSMLQAGSAEYEKRSKELAMMEATEVEKIDAQPSPRVLNCHLPLRLLNQQQIKEKKVKVIHVYRNAKDVLASSYFHIRQMAEHEINMENALHTFFIDGVPGMKYVKYMREMEEWHKANPEVPFFLTSYEETKMDPKRVVRDLAQFLGVKASPQLVSDIVEATSLHKMREASKTKEKTHISNIQFYRKGQVGDWKNHLTVAQSERVDDIVKALESCDYHFRYTL